MKSSKEVAAASSRQEWRRILALLAQAKTVDDAKHSLSCLVERVFFCPPHQDDQSTHDVTVSFLPQYPRLASFLLREVSFHAAAFVLRARCCCPVPRGPLTFVFHRRQASGGSQVLLRTNSRDCFPSFLERRRRQSRRRCFVLGRRRRHRRRRNLRSFDRRLRFPRPAFSSRSSTRCNGSARLSALRSRAAHSEA